MIISERKTKIETPKDIVNIIQPILDAEHETDWDREHFWAIGLNTKNVTKYVELTALGDLALTCASPRNVFRLAIMRACRAIIVCHNHPSGDPWPSPEDDEATENLINAGRIIRIAVIDHIILGHGHEYYSYTDHERMKTRGDVSTFFNKKSIKNYKSEKLLKSEKMNLNFSAPEKLPFDDECRNFRQNMDRQQRDFDERCDRIQRGIEDLEKVAEEKEKQIKQNSERIARKRVNNC